MSVYLWLILIIVLIGGAVAGGFGIYKQMEASAAAKEKEN